MTAERLPAKLIRFKDRKDVRWVFGLVQHLAYMDDGQELGLAVSAFDRIAIIEPRSSCLPSRSANRLSPVLSFASSQDSSPGPH